METKINLDQCRIEEITEEYRIQKLDTQGNLITESLPLYNLTAEEELNADIQVEKNGSLKIILTDRSWKEFQKMRVILAGVKNQEIYFENAVTAEKENELLQISLQADNSYQARQMTLHFEEQPEIIYRSVLSLLSGDAGFLLDGR